MPFCSFYDKDCPQSTLCRLWNDIASMCTFVKHTELLQSILDAQGGTTVTKSGSIASVSDASTSVVVFTTAFSTTPHVVACFADEIGAVDIIEIRDITTTGFIVCVLKGHGGANHDHAINWIATDAGNP